MGTRTTNSLPASSSSFGLRWVGIVWDGVDHLGFHGDPKNIKVRVQYLSPQINEGMRVDKLYETQFSFLEWGIDKQRCKMYLYMFKNGVHVVTHKFWNPEFFYPPAR